MEAHYIIGMLVLAYWVRIERHKRKAQEREASYWRQFAIRANNNINDLSEELGYSRRAHAETFSEKRWYREKADRLRARIKRLER